MCIVNERGCSKTAKAIANLNDRFRSTFVGGSVYVTRGVDALGSEAVVAILTAVREFDVFTKDNDPHHEHDFGSFTHEGEKLFWKIDCYDTSMQSGSEEPDNPKVTRRVLTVMLAEEY